MRKSTKIKIDNGKAQKVSKIFRDSLEKPFLRARGGGVGGGGSCLLLVLTKGPLDTENCSDAD